MMWRVARQAFGMDDIDPLVPPAAPATASGSASSPKAEPSPRKKVKMNSAVDQLDETEVEILTNNEVEAAYRVHREAMGADPLPDCDPTPEQITAMHAKVIKRDEAPYADFSVMTPYGRRSQKQSKARNFLLQMDGTWKTVEIPGPPTFAAWLACWKVYKSVLLMLKHPPNSAAGVPPKNVVTVAALEEYVNRISELNDEFPEAWHLLLQAEDKCRGEQFERFRRELTRAKMEGRLPMNLSFDEGQPWVGVFCYAARSQDFWDRCVVRPAQTFIARGGTGKNMTKKEAEDTQYNENTAAAMHRAPGEGLSKAARKRQRDKAKIRDLMNPQKFADAPWNVGKTPSGGDGAKGSGSGGHPRKSGKEFQTDRDGNQICFAFAKGALGACPEPCKNQRSHCCQYCLGAHPNSQCTQKPNGQKPGGKGK